MSRRSDGRLYGVVFFKDLEAPEVAELRANHRAAYGFWLHLQASTMMGQDYVPGPAERIARAFGDPGPVRSVSRWCRQLEELGLLERAVPKGGREIQGYRLLKPPSVRGQSARVSRAEERVQELSELIQGGLCTLEASELRKIASKDPAWLNHIAAWLRGNKRTGPDGFELKRPRKTLQRVRSAQVTELAPAIARELLEIQEAS